MCGDSFRGGIELIKVTVQLETEGNGQNEIFNHMFRSEVKFENSEFT